MYGTVSGRFGSTPAEAYEFIVRMGERAQIVDRGDEVDVKLLGGGSYGAFFRSRELCEKEAQKLRDMLPAKARALDQYR